MHELKRLSWVAVSQAGLWVFTALATGEATEVGRVAGCMFLATVSVAAAGGFMVYGGRLFLMLRRFPVESRGRTKKLREVRPQSAHLLFDVQLRENPTASLLENMRMARESLFFVVAQ